MNILKVLGGFQNDNISKAVETIPGDKSGNSLDILVIFNWVYALAGLVAVGYIVYGAYMYLTSVGSPDKVKSASRTIVYAVIGLVIVLLAAAITNFIAGGV